MGVKSLLARISAGELEYESCSLHRTFSEICTAQIWTFPGGLGASEGTWEHVNALKFKIRKLQPYFIVPRDVFFNGTDSYVL